VKRKDLVAAFREIGAPDPEAWADAQLEQDIPHLHRYAFLTQAWNSVVEPDNQVWIDNQQREGGPPAEALARLIAAGIAPDDLTAVVRVMQLDVLFSICYLIDCPDPVETTCGQIDWGLFSADSDGMPVEWVNCLHEDVLGTDPYGEGATDAA
jgi:hypothetical protein